jgi:hypothetical protein
MGSQTTGDEIMPEPTSPQFDALWTAAYRPRGGNINPDPRVAQSIYDNRQGRERYGNRTNELSELGRAHVDNVVNNLASHGGGRGQTADQIADITADRFGRSSPFTAVSGQDDVWDRIMGRETDTHSGLIRMAGDGGRAGDLAGALARLGSGEDTHSGLAGDEFDYEDQNVRGPDYSQPDPFDRSNPVEDRQARAIEDMNETLEE